ncbi:MAG: Bifunctional glutamine synthetase adenylyltransferase/adenylyl-removing enzyme [Gammaproteobacteria bacterium]|nr:Bifunctional glutamine synthetase adenylyltransferase/adenylyl-removing enzyme [Gammaproteobacteria bacterium]
MSLNLDHYIQAAPNPQAAAIRMERLCAEAGVEQRLQGMQDTLRRDLINIVSLSNFLFHFLIRHPDAIALLGTPPRPDERELNTLRNLDELRLYKYQELLKITWMDVSGLCDYREVLAALSKLAIDVVRQTLRLSLPADHYQTFTQCLSVLALGKLGAYELNYSSDIDLIFVCVNPDKSLEEYQSLQKLLFDCIRILTQTLEEKTAEGFLYRVDLKLRPWGKSGPLCMAIDDTEHYYAVSSVPWERFAWIRARLIAGSEFLGNDLLLRMRPFVYKRSLSTDDLNKFIVIKSEMSDARKRRGHWNVKVGEGGIRDIEFFIQMLQLANGARQKQLQTNSTLSALSILRETGLISVTEEQEVLTSYIFLRRLENRLQIVDERQVHDLPDERDKRLVLARSLAVNGDSDVEVLNNFEDTLITHRSIAKKYFDRILPGEQTG